MPQKPRHAHRLTQLDALLIDLQTTGGSPPGAHPLELALSTGGGEVAVWEFALTEEMEVARRVRKMHDLDSPRPHAIAPAQAWDMIASRLGQSPLLIAHYARFERRFVEHSLPTLDARWICTHAIARRLLPQIPRAGLTAIAGYFGHRLSAKHSAEAHVEATRVIWQHLVEMLHEQQGIDTLAELESWLDAPQSPALAEGTRARYAIDREHRLSLPASPGVYRFFDRGDHLLYIGKATDLRARVNSYFRTRRGLSEARLELVSQVARVETQAHTTALEAALAEVDAIKAHAPPYNHALLPRQRRPLFINRHGELADHLDAHHRFGPLFSARALHEARAIWTLEQPWSTEAAKAARARFARDHSLNPDRFGPLSTWFRAGASLWPPPDPAELTQDDADDANIAETSDSPLEDLPHLDEDAVYRRLQSCARRLSWQLRRARILSQLVDARLIWRPPAQPDCLRTIELREGLITQRATLALSTDLPCAPLPDRGWLERLALLDDPTHDRLRVLATEVRRLITDAPHLEVHTPGHRYDRDALRAIWATF